MIFMKRTDYINYNNHSFIYYILIIFIIFIGYSCEEEKDSLSLKFNINLPSIDKEMKKTTLTSYDFDRLENSQLVIEIFPKIDLPENKVIFNIKDDDCITLDKEAKSLQIDCTINLDIYNNSHMYSYIKDKDGIYLATVDNLIIAKGKEDETQVLDLVFIKIIKFSIENFKEHLILGYSYFTLENILYPHIKRAQYNKESGDSFLFPVPTRSSELSLYFNIFFEVFKGSEKGIVLPFKLLTKKQNGYTEISTENRLLNSLKEELSCYNGDSCKYTQNCILLDNESKWGECLWSQVGNKAEDISKKSILNPKLYSFDSEEMNVSSILITNNSLERQDGELISKRKIINLEDYKNIFMGSIFLTGFNFEKKMINSKINLDNKIIEGRINIYYKQDRDEGEELYLSYDGVLTLYPLKNLITNDTLGWVLQNRFPFYKLCQKYLEMDYCEYPYLEDTKMQEIVTEFINKTPKEIKLKILDEEFTIYKNN